MRKEIDKDDKESRVIEGLKYLGRDHEGKPERYRLERVL